MGMEKPEISQCDYKTGRQSVNTSNVLSCHHGRGQARACFADEGTRQTGCPFGRQISIGRHPYSNCINSASAAFTCLSFNYRLAASPHSQSYNSTFSAASLKLAANKPTPILPGTRHCDAVRKNMIHFMNHDGNTSSFSAAGPICTNGFPPNHQT